MQSIDVSAQRAMAEERAAARLASQSWWVNATGRERLTRCLLLYMVLLLPGVVVVVTVFVIEKSFPVTVASVLGLAAVIVGAFLVRVVLADPHDRIRRELLRRHGSRRRRWRIHLPGTPEA